MIRTTDQAYGLFICLLPDEAFNMGMMVIFGVEDKKRTWRAFIPWIYIMKRRFVAFSRLQASLDRHSLSILEDAE
jgi:hypothetical protein